MNFLRSIAAAFVNTFGITPPTANTENRAAGFIAILLGLVALIFLLAVIVAIHFLHQR